MRSGRRQFLQASAVAALGARLPAQTGALSPQAANFTDTGLTIEGSSATFSLRYTRKDDRLELFDLQKRLVLSTPLQPVIVEQPVSSTGTRALAAVSSRQTLRGDRIHLEYTLPESSGVLTLDLRLTAQALWVENLQYTSLRPVDIVSVHYFSLARGQMPLAALKSSFLVIPGISEGSSVSPIQSEEVGLNETVWLGRGSSPTGLNQQWALPVHYFCGFSKLPLGPGTRDLYTRGISAAFACGLANLPNGDLFLTLDHGRSSLWIDYRSDLWHHTRGPATLQLGATLCLTVAPAYYQAIRSYYAALLHEKIISIPPVSERKRSTLLSPQFCTWGAQVVRGNRGSQLSQSFLDDIYAELQHSGMKATLFSIDDKWEGTYGALTHNPARLPRFEQLLDRIRADGHRIGLWTALMRCEDPAQLGLTLDHMLHARDGSPLREGSPPGYYLLDFTQPAVAAVLQNLARRFMQRYKPDLVKFDFGYELPNVSQAAPADRAFMGERLLTRGLEVVIPALREVNPDVVVMYYNLSPLYLPYFDLHGLDDIFEAYREFAYEANRRLYFSSLLGSLGVPTYGSSGYDWASAPEIWFDSAASGTIGSLNDFTRDEAGEKPTPQLIARYNGVTRALRSSRIFEILPIGGPQLAPTQGAHAQSWVRFEDGQPVLLARRPQTVWSDVKPGLPTALSPGELNLSNLAVAAFPLIVASTTADPIQRSRSLIVVPFGQGRIAVKTELHGLATLLLHHLGGKSTSQTAQPQNGYLTVTPQLQLQNPPLESISIEFS